MFNLYSSQDSFLIDNLRKLLGRRLTVINLNSTGQCLIDKVMFNRQGNV